MVVIVRVECKFPFCAIAGLFLKGSNAQELRFCLTAIAPDHTTWYKNRELPNTQHGIQRRTI